MIGGQLVADVRRKKPPFWVWNAPMKQLYMSSYHLEADNVAFYVDALEKYRIQYVWGYASSLYFLASEILRLGIDPPAMVIAGTESEPVFDYQRTAIEKAFRCRVLETYGMGEMVSAAGPCEKGTFHLWPEAGIVELYDGDSRVPDQGEGDIVAPGLANPDMVFVRFRVGDRGRGIDRVRTCACGRTLPALGGVEGRIDDVLWTADGRAIGRLSPVPKGLNVVEMQFLQNDLGRIYVRYVPTPEWSQDDRAAVVSRLEDRFGRIEVVFERHRCIPRGPRGKLRLAVCALPVGIRKLLAETRGCRDSGT